MASPRPPAPRVRAQSRLRERRAPALPLAGPRSQRGPARVASAGAPARLCEGHPSRCGRASGSRAPRGGGTGWGPAPPAEGCAGSGPQLPWHGGCGHGGRAASCQPTRAEPRMAREGGSPPVPRGARLAWCPAEGWRAGAGRCQGAGAGPGHHPCAVCGSPGRGGRRAGRCRGERGCRRVKP